MQARAQAVDQREDLEGDLDQYDLVDTVKSLRKDVWTLTSDLQQLLKENVRLKRELEQRRAEPRGEGVLSDLHRVKDEVDELSRRYEETLSRRRERRPARTMRSEGRDSRLRQMMMLMIMSELF